MGSVRRLAVFPCLCAGVFDAGRGLWYNAGITICEVLTMHYTGNVFRPPFEARSLLLQVTVGCSHNRCSFCTMYRDTPFRMEPLEQIEQDLDEASLFYPNTRRVFLENGDPFVLPSERLTEIARMIHEKLPEVETIAMYASIKNIHTKTDAELRRLRDLRINDLNIGVESGYDPALTYMNKDHTAEEAVRELRRLKAAGMDFGLNLILGCAGSGNGEANAVATAELVNTVQPNLIFTGTMHSDPGCPLDEDMRSGVFAENTVGEYLDETEALVSRLELEHCRYFALHPSNIVRVDAMLPRDKDELLREIRLTKAHMSAETLASRPRRFGEGAVLV